MLEFGTKEEAVAHATALGYTELEQLGWCGDGPYGSRIYLTKPNPERNEFGAANDVLTLSSLDGKWWSSK